MQEPRPSSSSPVVPLILGAIVVAVVAGAFFFVFAGRPAAPGGGVPADPNVAQGTAAPAKGEPSTDPGERFSLEEKRELIRTSQIALGHLENENWREALAGLSKIQEKFPEDPFATRNSAIAVSLAAKLPSQVTPKDIPVQDAEAAALAVLKASPDDVISHILAGRIAAKLGDSQLALERFQKAVELDAKSATGWYELFSTLQDSTLQGAGRDAKTIKEQQKDALLRVLELRPENVRVLNDLMDAMVKTEDKRVLDLLKKMEARMPVLLRIYEERKGDGKLGQIYPAALETVTKALQGAAPPNWRVIGGQVSFVKNLTNFLDPVVRERDQLQPNSLEFIQLKFKSPAFHTPDIDAADLHPAIPVKFIAAAEQLGVTEPPLDIKLEDYDLDERVDVWVLTPGKLRIFGTAANSPTWKLLSELQVPEGFTKFLLADLDWDIGTAAVAPPLAGSSAKPTAEEIEQNCKQTDADLLLYGPGGIRIYKNELGADQASRTWVAIEKSGLEDLKDVTTVAATDFDHEGDLDLAIGTPDGLRLWSNREQFTFKDVSADSVLPEKFVVRNIIPVDFDRDVAIDLLVFGDGDGPQSSGIMVNHLHGVLEWRTFEQQELSQIPAGLRDPLVIDADRNVSWDVIGLGAKEAALALTRTTGAGMTKSLRTDSLPDVLNGGVRMLDFDNDGYLDLVSWAGKSLRVLRGTSDAKFSPQSDVAPAELAAEIQDCQVADLDADGDQELVVRTADSVHILSNDGGNANHWLDIRVRGRQIKDRAAELSHRRINHQGIGSVLEINSGGYYLPQLVTGSSTHFGLGKRTVAEQVRVILPNGVPQDEIEVKGKLNICELQEPKGSCPFAYTWDGERFTFFTDLLWNAPLGLQFAEGVLAPARQWEYLKIPGNRMVPKGDKYVLQITEELWEATYFDQIELLAVDHPADVEVYSNEKVGPASISEFKIHTVRDPRPVIAAHDQRGRDILTEVSLEDGQFTKCYDAVLRQGLTTEHWLELDLGPITETGPLTLFLTGWMYPTETSISVAVSQNAANKQARPPALWVPDANGEWKEIRPFMGFPGGKTKTIAVDLTGVFAGSDRRLRIVTNMQFHWDHAFFSVGETPAQVRTQSLQLESADLHYRGLSHHYWKDGNGPDQYDYNTVLPDPDWAPMRGMFTRYGDVSELLTKSDDLLAVIGAGDEITVTFAMPDKPLPEGWKRDFILHNVGWDKDADLNTLYGQTVEPMPFNSMSSYPYPASEGPFETAEYETYLRKYQTRVQDYNKFWRRLKQGRNENRSRGASPTLSKKQDGG